MQESDDDQAESTDTECESEPYISCVYFCEFFYQFLLFLALG